MPCGRAVVAATLVCALLQGCDLWPGDELESGSSPDTSPDVAIMFEGGVDDDGLATVASSGEEIGLRSLELPADALVLRITGGLDPGSGMSWDLRAVMPRDAVLAGEPMRLAISGPLAHEVGEAIIQYQSGHGEGRANATHGVILVTVDPCARTIEGEARVAPEHLAATFRGDVDIRVDVACPSADAG